MDAMERIIQRTVRSAGRVALEAAIAAIEKSESRPTSTRLTPKEQYYYRQGLADAKVEILTLLSVAAE